MSMSAKVVRKKWSRKELEIMKKYYVKEGYTIEKRLPGRNREVIRNKAFSLGLHSPLEYEYGDWLPEEDEIIQKHYKDGVNTVKELLPHRSISGIMHRAQRLRILRVVPWTIEEEEILRKWYPIEGQSVIERLPNRTKNSISQKVTRMGLKRGDPL